MDDERTVEGEMREAVNELIGEADVSSAENAQIAADEAAAVEKAAVEEAIERSSWDDDHDGDTNIEEEVAAAASHAVPRLHKGIPMSELEAYLKNYEAPCGMKLFAEAKVEMLAHYTMDSLYSLSSNLSKWRHVSDNLFGGDKTTADIFMLKILDAKRLDMEASTAAARRLTAAEAKRVTDSKRCAPVTSRAPSLKSRRHRGALYKVSSMR